MQSLHQHQSWQKHKPRLWLVNCLELVDTEYSLEFNNVYSHLVHTDNHVHGIKTFLERFLIVQLIKIFLIFVEPKTLLLCSQNHNIAIYPELTESSSCIHILLLRDPTITLSFMFWSSKWSSSLSIPIKMISFISTCLSSLHVLLQPL